MQVKSLVCHNRRLFSTHLRYWYCHDHSTFAQTYLFTDALTGIILWVYQAGWSMAVKKRWNWLAEGFKDVCVLRFCLFSLVLSTQGQSNSFSKASKLHNLLEDILPTQGQNSHKKPWGQDAYKWENPQTDRIHHAFIGKKLLDDR